MKKLFSIILVGLWLVSSTAFGAEFIAPQREEDPNVTISASETKNNLYTVGANVAVNGKITGDLVTAGGMVTLIGDVEEDLNVAGGSLALSGTVVRVGFDD
jgi:hypothetical protein